jgi:FlaG/FlaF family flagellin (archaellin)
MRVPRFTSVGLSPLVAIILLIAITVAAAVVVSGVFFNLAGIAGRRPAAVIDSVKLVATTGGAGTWAVVVKNTGDVPIQSITSSFPDGCSASLTFDPLPAKPGQTTAATGDATGCTLGNTYPIELTVNFQDGSVIKLTTQVTAALA